jgi:prevent-host-death family protein
MSRQRKKPVKAVTLSNVRAGLSKYLKAAEREEVVITRNGRPAGVLIGFADEDDWFDYRLGSDPRFLTRVADARRALKAGRGVRIEDL